MAELTNLESKLAEVLALAIAAKDATDHVAKLPGDENESLRATLERMHGEAAVTEERCTQLAGEFDGKKTAILGSARETRSEAAEMMEAYLDGDDDPLDGFEFLTMAEAGEVGHWSTSASSTSVPATRRRRARRLGAADPAPALR